MPEPVQTFCTNVVHAKPSAHALTISFGVAEAVWLYLKVQPIFAAWLIHHPWIPVLHGALQVAYLTGATYFQSLKRAA